VEIWISKNFLYNDKKQGVNSWNSKEIEQGENNRFFIKNFIEIRIL
jgi:hypothetical protein